MGQPLGILALPVALAVHKDELHAPAFGRAQGCVADGLGFTAYDAGGAQPGSATRRRQRMDVIGVSPPKRQQVSLSQSFGLLQVVFELAPLVAREGRMDQIIPFTPEPDPLGIQQGMVELVQWRGKLARGQQRLTLAWHTGHRCIVCHKSGG
ncbi:hypothetical protein D3C80_1636020 [compost metagenome]